MIFVLVGFQCREKYEVLLMPAQANALVIEGIVNANGPTNIRLTRTTDLALQSIVPEMGATVIVEGEDNSTFRLTGMDSGYYHADAIPINPSLKYRMRIMTAGQHEYLSDYRDVLATQKLDSISHITEGDSVRFFINSYEDEPQKYYFKWDVEETWQIRSPFATILKFTTTGVGDSLKVGLEYANPVNHSVDESVRICWQSRISRDINIGTTQQLTSSKIQLPVKVLQRSSIELGETYSMLVKQYALSADGYDFYRRMKKNTESLGSIFDAQPTEITGNIQCVSHPGELVVGFVEFSELEEKRIFVRSSDLPGTPFDQNCTAFGAQNSLYIYPFENSPEVRLYAYKTLELFPTKPVRLSAGSLPLTFEAQNKYCVDCTLRGTNVKPSFWP